MISSGLIQSVIGQCTAPTWGPSNKGTRLLVPHRNDRSMKSMLDHSEVLKMIKFQGDEMVRLRRLEDDDNSIVAGAERLDTSSDKVPSGNKWDAESSIFGTPTEYSFAAKTDVTTATGATRPVVNSDRPVVSAKSNFRRKADRFKAMESIASQNGLPRSRRTTPTVTKRAPSRETDLLFGSPSSLPRHPRSPQKAPGSPPKIISEESAIELQKMRSGSSKESQKKDDPDKLPPGAQLTGIGCSALVDPFATDKLGSLREEYGVALHLKMHAKCAKFYWSTYRRVFPDAPLPEAHDLDLSQKSSLQTISQSSSSDNSVTPHIGYGEDVHSYSIQMMVDDSDFLDLGMTGSLGLVHRIEVSENGQLLKSPRYYKVLLNRRSGVPIAVCALKSPHGRPVVRIFATKPRVKGQKPAASTKALGLTWCPRSFPLYAWAEFSAEGDFPNPVRYSLFMSKGSGRFETDPSYRASHKTAGSPEIVVVGKTETEKEYTGSALLSLQTDDTNFALCVARGIDPALMICLTGIVDEVMENSMRIACDATGTRKPKAARPLFVKK